MRLTIWEYLYDNYDATFIKCSNCGCTSELVENPENDGFICEKCAKNSYYDSDSREVDWRTDLENEAEQTKNEKLGKQLKQAIELLEQVEEVTMPLQEINQHDEPNCVLEFSLAVDRFLSEVKR